jgi:hypothetical protein
MPRISAGARETPAAVRNGDQSAETRELGEFEAARFAPDLCTEKALIDQGLFSYASCDEIVLQSNRRERIKDDTGAAQDALARQQHVKERRGYCARYANG